MNRWQIAIGSTLVLGAGCCMPAASAAQGRTTNPGVTLSSQRVTQAGDRGSFNLSGTYTAANGGTLNNVTAVMMGRNSATNRQFSEQFPITFAPGAVPGTFDLTATS